MSSYLRKQPKPCDLKGKEDNSEVEQENGSSTTVVGRTVGHIDFAGIEGDEKIFVLSNSTGDSSQNPVNFGRSWLKYRNLIIGWKSDFIEVIRDNGVKTLIRPKTD